MHRRNKGPPRPRRPCDVTTPQKTQTIAAIGLHLCCPDRTSDIVRIRLSP